MDSTHTIINKIASYCENNIKKYDIVFQENTKLGVQFYTQLKSELESNVVSWKWATDRMFSPEPFYFQEKGYKQGEWLDNKPDNMTSFYCYGLDLDNRIIIERHGFYYFGNSDREPEYYETFYHYDLLNQVVQSTLFLYNFKTHPANQYFFEYENDKLIYAFGMFNPNQSKSNILDYYATENDLYLAKYTFDISNQSLVNSNYIVYRHTPNKLLDTIERIYIDTTQLLYKSATNEIDVNTVKAWLINYIKVLIEKNKPTDKIYSFFLEYDYWNKLPPHLCYGYEFYREEISRRDEFDFHLLWHPAEFPNEFSLPYSSGISIPLNVFLFQQEAKYADQKKLLCEVAIEIKTWLKQNYATLLTNDFSVMLTDFELNTFDYFFKLINPEIYENVKFQFENF